MLKVNFRSRRQLLALGFGEPLKVFEQFTGFHGEGGGKVLGRMELVPVAITGEGAEFVAEGFEVGHGWGERSRLGDGGGTVGAGVTGL